MAAPRRVMALAVVSGLVGIIGCRSVPPAADETALPWLYDPLHDAPAVPAQQAAAGRTLSVLSFNMQHRDRPPELAVMADYLGDEGPPDFILCQEVRFQRPAVKGPDNTAAVLADALGYYCRGTARRHSGEGVAIVSRYPFTYYNQRHLRARTSPLLLGFNRVSAMGEFIVPGVGLVRVVTTHLAYLPFEGHVRRQQMDETLAWIAARQRVQPAAVTILGGDFNALRGSRELAGLANPLICGDLQYLDLNGDAPTFGSPRHLSKRIDFIFVASEGRPLRLLHEKLLYRDGLWHRDGTRRFWLSDHLPVLHQYAVESDAVALGD